MRQKRIFIDGAYYHVTSRTNDRIRVFGNKLGQKIMLMTLQNAKEKYRFHLANFCVMPTHIHLLIKPREGTSLSRIMQWIKTCSAKWWNSIHGSEDHMWGKRYFARVIKNPQEFDHTMGYIDQNPVVAELAATPADWKASGAFYRAQNIPGIVDLNLDEKQPQVEQLSLIPHAVSRLMPAVQLGQIIKYYGAYAEDIDRLYDLVPKIPKLDETFFTPASTFYLHYCTITSDYFICGFDGEDTMYGKVRNSLHPGETKFCKFSLSKLLSTPLMKLDLSWKVTDTEFS